MLLTGTNLQCYTLQSAEGIVTHAINPKPENVKKYHL